METKTAETLAGGTIPEVTFGSLYREHHPRVLAYFLRRFDRDTAVDCAADVFTVAWRRHEDVPAGDRTLPWLYGVCHNVARNQQRGARRRGRLAAALTRQPVPEPTRPDAAVVEASEGRQVLAALERLRPADRELLRLATWEELPHADIAAVLGISRHAVDERIRRAVARLRAEYEKGGRR